MALLHRRRRMGGGGGGCCGLGRRLFASLGLAALAIILITTTTAAASPAGQLLRLPHATRPAAEREGSMVSRSSQRWQRQQPPAAVVLPAWQALERRVAWMNNGTRLALAGALAGGFSNRTCGR